MKFFLENMRKITSFTMIPRLRRYLLEKIRKQPENRFSSFGDSIFFFSFQTIFDTFLHSDFFLFLFNIFGHCSSWNCHRIFFEKKSFNLKSRFFSYKKSLKKASFSHFQPKKKIFCINYYLKNNLYLGKIMPGIHCA